MLFLASVLMIVQIILQIKMMLEIDSLRNKITSLSVGNDQSLHDNFEDDLTRRLNMIQQTRFSPSRGFQQHRMKK